MTVLIPILIITPIILFFYFCFKSIKILRKNSNTFIFEYFIFTLYIISIFIFAIGFLSSGASYKMAIAPNKSGYSPLGYEHILTLLVFFTLFLVSCRIIWLKGRNIPPLILVLALVFLIIGTLISLAILIQVLSIEPSNTNNECAWLFAITPILSIIISVLLFLKIINEETMVSNKRQYQNKILNFLNTTLAKTQYQPIWVVVLLIPIFIIITLILTLLGQDTNAMAKVFTETSTWHFSQQTHPPYLDHQGHYLCTVAACGNPKIVRPIRFGNRHVKVIIVNRQLMIANAYEEMIQDYLPKFHKLVRTIYDNYGYSFSKHINTPMRSNIIYFVMKPLEWFFLLKLYLFCKVPETKINNQYKKQI